MHSLPAKFEDTLQHGIVALREVEVELRARMQRAREPEVLLLEIRNVGMLADRLEDETPEEWRVGASICFNRQDVAVLREWADTLDVASPYADELAAREHPEGATRLHALATFLEWYLDNRFELLEARDS